MSPGARIRIGALLGLAALVPACGGGGSGGTAATADGLAFLSAIFAASEGDGSVTVTVHRTGSSGEASVNYSTGIGTATDGADYTATSGMLSWADGETGDKSFTIDVAGSDAAQEGTETVPLALSLNRGAALGVLSTATLVLRDVDAPSEGAFQFSALTYTVSEGNATVTATITVERNGGAGTASVEVLVADGTATNADYGVTAPDTSPVLLSWADGEATAKTFSIDIFSDGADGAPVETVVLTLQNPLPSTNGPVIATTLATATLEIVDNDAAGTVQLSAANYSAFENGVSATITVTRTGGSLPANVDVQVADGAATPAVAGTDYVAPAPNPVALTWAEGDITPRTVVIALIDDALNEGNERIDVSLANVGGAALGGTSSAQLAVLDDEPGTIEISTPLVSVVEGDAGTVIASVTVTRTGGSAGSVTAEVNVANGATNGASAGTDYVAPATNPVPLTWANGDSAAKTVNVTVNGDTDVETDETIDLTLQNVVGAGTGVQTTATITITNDDVPTSGTLAFEATNPTTVLETAGTITLLVNRVGGTSGALAVNFATANGTAVSNGNPNRRDFVAQNGTLNWAAGDATPQPITISINNNDGNVDAANETFTVTLTSNGGSVISGPAQVTITIQEN